MPIKEISKEEIESDLEPDYWELVNRWLAAGKGIAVYQNQDLGHPGLGHMKFVSYGTPEAQLEGDTPPERLPDIGGEINWRYGLVGIYRSAPLGGGPVKVEQ